MVKSSMARGRSKFKKTKRGDDGSSLNDQSRNDSSIHEEKRELLARERNLAKNALLDNRRISGAQTSEARKGDGGESETEAPNSPKVAGGINAPPNDGIAYAAF